MNTSPLRFKPLIAPLLFALAASPQAAQTATALPALLAQAPATPEPTTEPGWQEVVSSTGDFSVLMPGEPEEVPNYIPAGQPLHDLRIFLVRTAEPAETTVGTVYSFGYGTEVSLPAQPSPDQIDQYFNRLRALWLGGEGARLLNEQPLSVDGNWGREIEVGQADPSGQLTYVTRMRIYVIGQKMYLLQMIAASPDLVHSPEAERFFNSFKRRSAVP